jgi:outer membrane protein assembly factor BamB
LQQRAVEVAAALSPPPSEPLPEIESAPSRTFRGDARRRHRSALLGPQAAPGVTKLHEAPGAIAAMPAVLEGGDIVVASLGGRLARLSPSGEVRWKIDLGDRIYASPLVAGDRVIVGSDADRVYAVRLDKGRIAWQLPVEADADTAPAEAPDGTIVIAAGSSLYAIRPNGSVRFRVRARRKIYGSPAIGDDGTIYFGSQDDHLYAIAPAGARLWGSDLGADVDCAPLVGEAGMVYAGTDGGVVFALDKTGAVRWRASVGGYVRGGLSLGLDGSVLAGVYGPRPGVVALDPETGAERFAFRIRDGGSRELGVHGGPIVDGRGNLYFGTQDDTVVALNPVGRLRWSVGLGADVDAPLVLGESGLLYAGTEDGRIYAIR